MSTDNIWGNADNITIEYEKVIDENPLVWLQAAEREYTEGNYKEALNYTKQAREFIDNKTNLLLQADMIDSQCYIFLGEYISASKILSKYTQINIVMYYSSTPKILIDLLHIDLPNDLRNTLEKYWYQIVADWTKSGNFNHINQYIKHIQPTILSALISPKDIPAIIKDDYITILKYLVTYNYNFVDVRDAQGQNVIQIATTYYKYNILEYFIKERVCNVNNIDNNGNDALSLAVANNFTGAIPLLAHAGANMNPLCDISGLKLPILQKAIVNKVNDSTISTLIQIGIDINATDSIGYNALDYAVIFNRPNLVNKLFSAGAVIKNDALVYIACGLNCQTCIVKTLIEHGGNVHYTDKYGRDALFFSCADDASVTSPLAQYFAILFIKRQTYNFNTINALFEAGVDINHQYPPQGNTILHMIAKGKHWENKHFWQQLLYLPLNINIQNYLGYTPIMYSVDHKWTFSDELDLARELVKKGADLSLTNRSGETVNDIMRGHNIDPAKLHNTSSSNFFTKLFS